MGLFDRLGERAASSAAPAAPSAPEPGSVEAIAAGNVTLLQFLRRESGQIPNRAYILARTIAQHLDDVVADLVGEEPLAVLGTSIGGLMDPQYLNEPMSWAAWPTIRSIAEASSSPATATSFDAAAGAEGLPDCLLAGLAEALREVTTVDTAFPWFDSGRICRFPAPDSSDLRFPN